MSTITSIYGLANSKLDKNTDDAVKELCTICFTNPVNTMCDPCKHMCLCNECVPALKKNTSVCPMCRAKITKFITLDS